MSSRIYTTIENLPNALSISLSSALAIYKQPDTFALRLSTTNGLFWTTINPPLSAQLTSLSSTAFVAISALMPLSGGQMTGPLILNNAVPLEALHLASKKYVDDADALHVLRSGDTMVGYLSVNIPNRAGEITPKQYVDNRDVTIDYIIGLNFSGYKAVRFVFNDRNQAVDNAYASKIFVSDNSNRLKFIGSDGPSFAGGGTGSSDSFYIGNICSIPFLSSGEYAISAASDGGFTIALSNYGNVYTTGNNSVGQLGINNVVTSYRWNSIPPSAFNYEPVTKIFLSDASAANDSKTGVLALTLSGNLYGWGANDDYQLSLSASAYYSSPRLINTPTNTHGGSIKNLKIKDAVLTGNGVSLKQFSAVIDVNGNVHAVGNNNGFLPLGRSSTGSNTSFSACKVQTSFTTESNMTADAIYGCGSSNLYAISANQLYAAGANASGQILNGRTDKALAFQKCQLAETANVQGNATSPATFANNVALVKAIAGTDINNTNATVFIVTTQGKVYCGGRRRVASGHVDSFAQSSTTQTVYAGQRRIGERTVTTLIPALILKCAIPVDSLVGKTIVDLKAVNTEFDFSVCVAKDSSGYLYSAGYNAGGALGVGNLQPIQGFQPIMNPNNVAWTDYVVIASSNNKQSVHVHAITTDGELFSWGSNELLQCGVSIQRLPIKNVNNVISLPIKTSIA